MSIKEKPIKKKDIELFQLIEHKIYAVDYVFTTHAKKRLKDRKIIELDVLNSLKVNMVMDANVINEKDKFDSNHEDWNYCIEGHNLDEKQIRIIFSFHQSLLLMITVIWLNE